MARKHPNVCSLCGANLDPNENAPALKKHRKNRNKRKHKDKQEKKIFIANEAMLSTVAEIIDNDFTSDDQEQRFYLWKESEND